MRDQLPDAFDLMARVVPAGQTMSQALQAVADEFPQPIAAEFSYCYEQQNLACRPRWRIRDLAGRTGLLELKIFVMACWSSSRPAATSPSCSTSSPPSSAQRYRIQGQIRTLTAEGGCQAVGRSAAYPGDVLRLRPGRRATRNPARPLRIYPGRDASCSSSVPLWIRKIVNFDL